MYKVNDDPNYPTIYHKISVYYGLLDGVLPDNNKSEKVYRKAYRKSLRKYIRRIKILNIFNEQN